MDEPISRDDAFINKLTGIVLDNISNEQFSVKKLAHEAGISHASLHRKLKQIKNLDGSQFIREIRLKRAMEYLERNAGTASEISFMVGFGSPAYFSKCFHDYYGFPPGEAKKRRLSNDLQNEEQNGTGEIIAAQNHQNSAVRSITFHRIAYITIALIIVILIPLSWNLYKKSREYKRSIIVLPFENLSGNPESQYLAGGIKEEILNSLTLVSELRVRSRTTSEQFHETELSAKKLAREVNSRYILEGSVRQYDGKTRITVQLIDGSLDDHLWTYNYDCDLTNIIRMQDSMALNIATRLKSVIPGIEIELIDRIRTISPEAYDDYLRGRFLLNNANGEQRTDISKEGLTGSIQCFERAIAADSSFAEAYAGLAKAVLSLAGWGWQQPRREGFIKAKEMSGKALSLNPDCAEAHAVKGAVLIWGERNFEAGRQELITALELNPNYPPVYQSYAQLLMITGPIREARKCMDKALEFEPYYWVLHNLNAWIYYFEGKYSKAIEACKSAQELKSDYIFTNWLFFLNYAKMGEGSKATEELKKIMQLYTDKSDYDREIADAYSKSGIPGLFEWLVDVNINRPVPATGISGHPFFVAWWYAILGDREQSVLWLQKNMKVQLKMSIYFDLIATNPDFDILRGDPRFLEIIDQLGLTSYNKRSAR